MYDPNKTLNERMADALERIADALERAQPRKPQKVARDSTGKFVTQSPDCMVRGCEDFPRSLCAVCAKFNGWV
jgi:hypothetical protein